jgi:hypothetical protein
MMANDRSMLFFPPQPFITAHKLDKEFINQRIATILNVVPLETSSEWGLHQQYYHLLTSEVEETPTVTVKELRTTKWRTYIYLKKCLIDYERIKNPNKNNAELIRLIEFLEASNANKSWFAKKLLDSPEQAEDEVWATGQHEWLERCLIVDVLKRSAGMTDDVEADAGYGCILGQIDWLFLQAELRSPTKYIFFKNEDECLRFGHLGAVKSRIGKGNTGIQTTGSPGFHEKLAEAFFESTKIASFIRRVKKIIKEEMVSGKKPLSPDVKRNYIVDGTRTDDENGVNEFRRDKLLPEGHRKTAQKIENLFDFATRGGDVPDDISASTVDTDTTEDDISDHFDEDDDALEADFANRVKIK